MNACKLRVPLRHGGTLNSHQAVSPLVRLMEGEERWETLDHLQGVLPQNWSGAEPNRTVTCTVLKAAVNDRRKYSPLPSMNFPGSESDSTLTINRSKRDSEITDCFESSVKEQ
ncbi:uncharacterized protein TNCV_3229571 [Trichonephila clavipes]|nr:uncharacterized protein TNCV_3229571 [Trichonephila clavipes]